MKSEEVVCGNSHTADIEQTTQLHHPILNLLALKALNAVKARVMLSLYKVVTFVRIAENDNSFL